MRLTTDFKSLLRFGLVILGAVMVIAVNVLYSLDASRGQRTPDSTSTPLAQHDVCLVPANGSSEATGYQGSIAYSYDGHLHILNLETREVQTFTGVRAMVAPDWYPYGRLLALGRGEIHILDSRSGEILTLTNSPDTLWDPSWSPDGRRLVYMQMSGERGLYILDIFSRERTKLNIGLWNPVHPAWSPDGKQIAFGASDETGLIQIYVVDLDTCSDSSECESTQLT
ncbi:MAG: PD40 domain-containing protein, partial [Anaerolineae bacterium]|nr:PD40 domain-containing protein [Anaerolineae bacterium]